MSQYDYTNFYELHELNRRLQGLVPDYYDF